MKTIGKHGMIYWKKNEYTRKCAKTWSTNSFGEHSETIWWYRRHSQEICHSTLLQQISHRETENPTSNKSIEHTITAQERRYRYPVLLRNVATTTEQACYSIEYYNTVQCCSTGALNRDIRAKTQSPVHTNYLHIHIRERELHWRDHTSSYQTNYVCIMNTHDFSIFLTEMP